MILGWLLTFLRKGQIYALMHLLEKKLEQQISQKLLKTKG